MFMTIYYDGANKCYSGRLPLLHGLQSPRGTDAFIPGECVIS